MHIEQNLNKQIKREDRREKKLLITFGGIGRKRKFIKQNGKIITAF